MERNKIIRISFSMMALIFLFSCNSGNSSRPGFYDYSKDFDICRIPLIEPLELKSADKGFSWNFKLPYRQIEKKGAAEHGIDKVGMDYHILVLYTSSTYLFDAMNQVWFVVDTRKKTEKAFINEKDYRNYLKEQGAETVTLYDVREVFVVFDTQRKLPSEWPKQPSAKSSAK